MTIFRISNSSLKSIFIDLTVVVLGILIAFQVEEWRELRNERTEEERHLRLILEDLDEGRLQFDQVEIATEQQIEGVENLVFQVQENPNPDVDSIVQSTPFYYWNWEPTNGAYVSLRDSGAISLISNESLYRALLTYFETFEPYFLTRINRQRGLIEEFRVVFEEDFDYVPNPDFASSGKVSRELRTPIDQYPSNTKYMNLLLRVYDGANDIVPRLEYAESLIDSLEGEILSHLESL